MGILSTLKDWFGPLDDAAIVNRAELIPFDLRSSVSGVLPGWSSGKPSWPSDSTIVLTRDGYRKCVTAFACVNIIADAVAEATLRVYLDKGQGKRDEIADHPLRQLLQRPSPDKSESEFLSLVVRTAAITGFCVIEKIRSARTNVVQLGRFDPRWIKPILRDQGAPDWQYTVPGHPPQIVSADDVIVFTYMDALAVDDATGDTPMRAILREAAILNDLTDFLKLLLERGGIPPFILVAESQNPEDGPLERLSDDEIEAIREQFRQRYAGYRNWTGPAVIDGMRVERVGLDLNQLAFKDLRDVIDLEVCRAFRVPAPVVQVMAGIESSYGKLLEESMTLLQMYTAGPIRSRLDGALTRSLLPEFDPRPNISLEFDTSDVDALQEDEMAVHERARADLSAGGITVDEFRQRIGEVPLKNDLGTSLLLPFSVVPTSTKAVVPKPIPDPSSALDPDDEERNAPVLVRSSRQYVNVRALAPTELARRAKVTADGRLQMLRLAEVVAPQIATFFTGQKERVLAALVGDLRSGMLLARRDSEILDWTNEDTLLRDLLRAWWQQVGETAFETASGHLGGEIAWDIANPKLRELLELLGYRITAINETTRQAIETVIREQLLAGTSMDELASKLTSLFEETYANRHVTVARTESQVAYNLMSERAYIESGVVASMQLADNPEHTTDPGSDGLTCSERNGLVVGLGQVQKHVYGEHPNGTLAVIPVLGKPLGEV